MDEAFRVVPDELRGYSELLGRNAEHLMGVRHHAIFKGGDTAGFTGVLSLLDPVVSGVAGWYGDALELASQMMAKDAEALAKSANAYEKADEIGVCLMDNVSNDLSDLLPSWLGGSK